jgi:hypothetical protein
MAKLKFTSETGMFHSALCANLGDGDHWYGYGPVVRRSSVGAGQVHTDDRSAFINHEINFLVADAALKSAISITTNEFNGTTYAVGIHDCVSFTAQVARRVGLTVPATNFLPYSFLTALAAANKYESFK